MLAARMLTRQAKRLRSATPSTPEVDLVTVTLSSAQASSSSSSSTEAADPDLPFIDQIGNALRSVSDAEKAAGMSKYMRNLFPFLGVAKNPRAEQTKDLVNTWRGDFGALAGDVRTLWALPEREFQYIALELLAKHNCVLAGVPTNKRSKRVRSKEEDEAEPKAEHSAEEALGLVEELIRSKSWWDTVDGLASNTLGGLLQHYPHLIDRMDDWNSDADMWIRRSSLLFQLKYKSPDEARLFRYVTNLRGETDFFIRKAIGWSLRQHSKLSTESRDSVREFLRQQGDKLSTLSIREASKYL